MHSWIPDGYLHQGHVDGPLIVHILLNREEAVLDTTFHSCGELRSGVHIIANIGDKAVAIHDQQGIVHLEMSHNWHMVSLI